MVTVLNHPLITHKLAYMRMEETGHTVKGMLPANVIGRKAITRLHVYAGAEHPHAAQKPVDREF